MKIRSLAGIRKLIKNSRILGYDSVAYFAPKASYCSSGARSAEAGVQGNVGFAQGRD